MVTRAAEQATDATGFFAQLREAGVLVRVRFSEIDPGQVTGYSVTLPGHTGPDGTPLWYGGGRLAAQARAAHAAAAHLHTAVNQSRPRTVRLRSCPLTRAYPNSRRCEARRPGLPCRNGAASADGWIRRATAFPVASATSAGPKSRASTVMKLHRAVRAQCRVGPGDLADGSLWPVGAPSLAERFDEEQAAHVLGVGIRLLRHRQLVISVPDLHQDALVVGAEPHPHDRRAVLRLW